MHSWQNGTRYRDGVNVLWCCSHPVRLRKAAGTSHKKVFRMKTSACRDGTLEVVREKRGWQGEDAWSVGYETWNCVVHKEQRIIINSNASKCNCKFYYVV